MKASPIQIESSLADVRRAYRLLHDYQRSALDTIKYIAARLGFVYRNGGPNFSDPAPRTGSSDLLDRWAWDWLNLVFFDFTFKPAEEPAEAQPVLFAIFLVSDTGYFLSERADVHKTRTETFETPESSGTKVGFFFFRDWPDNNNFINDRLAVQRFLQSGAELPEELRKMGVIGKCVDFRELADQESTDRVVASLEEWARVNGFHLAPPREVSK